MLKIKAQKIGRNFAIPQKEMATILGDSLSLPQEVLDTVNFFIEQDRKKKEK